MYRCLHKASSTLQECFHFISHNRYKNMRRHPVIIHQSSRNQSSDYTSNMERRPKYEAITANPSKLTPRNRTDSSSSSSSAFSSSSTSSSSFSRRKLIRDRYKRPWQLVSVITLHQGDVPAGRSGGLKSPYPTPGRKNYDRV